MYFFFQEKQRCILVAIVYFSNVWNVDKLLTFYPEYTCISLELIEQLPVAVVQW
jgi:hypothetical protein